MGTELAKHLIANNDYEVRVWNRTLDKTTPLVDAGATAYPNAAEAVTGVDVVITALFGPRTVHSMVIEPDLFPQVFPGSTPPPCPLKTPRNLPPTFPPTLPARWLAPWGRPVPENLVCTWAAPIRSYGSWLPALYPPGRTQAG